MAIRRLNVLFLFRLVVQFESHLEVSLFACKTECLNLMDSVDMTESTIFQLFAAEIFR